MVEIFSFDAMVDVEAESLGEAITLIFDHCAERDIAISLHKEGSLNRVPDRQDSDE